MQMNKTALITGATSGIGKSNGTNTSKTTIESFYAVEEKIAEELKKELAALLMCTAYI
jgi:short-subunit dehydrogenase